MDKIKKMLEDLEKELRANKQYSAADKLLPIIEEAKKDGWIPCSERLPKEEGMYLVTSNLFGILEVQYVFYSENVQMFVCNGTPVAWMSLPEPYKEE